MKPKTFFENCHLWDNGILRSEFWNFRRDRKKNCENDLSHDMVHFSVIFDDAVAAYRISGVNIVWGIAWV